MNGISTPQDSRAREPGAQTYSVNHKYKQLVRILRHLRDDLHKIQPQLAMPTVAMLEHMVFNCPLPMLQGDNWQQIIDRSLHYLIDHLDPVTGDDEVFLRSDVDEPLFPNEELFDAQDAYLFARALLEQQQDLT